MDKPVVKILAGYLDTKTLVSCSGVCKLWYKWFNLEVIWKIAYHRWFGPLPLKPKIWKLAFINERLNQKIRMKEYETRKTQQSALHSIPSYMVDQYIEPPPDKEPDINNNNQIFKKRTKNQRNLL